MSQPVYPGGFGGISFSPGYRNLSMNNLVNIYVANREGQLEQIVNNANMNDQNVRDWGVLNQPSALVANNVPFGQNSTNSLSSVGVYKEYTRINPSQNTQIALKQFQWLKNSPNPFEGQMTMGYQQTAASGYLPAGFSSGYYRPVGGSYATLNLGSHNNLTYNGLLGGANATHTLKWIYNSGFGVGGSALGFGLSFRIENPSQAYSASATDWTYIEVTYPSNNNFNVPQSGFGNMQRLYRAYPLAIGYSSNPLAAPSITVGSSSTSGTYYYQCFWSGYGSQYAPNPYGFYGIPVTGTYGKFGAPTSPTTGTYNMNATTAFKVVK